MILRVFFFMKHFVFELQMDKNALSVDTWYLHYTTQALLQFKCLPLKSEYLIQICCNWSNHYMKKIFTKKIMKFSMNRNRVGSCMLELAFSYNLFYVKIINFFQYPNGGSH